MAELFQWTSKLLGIGLVHWASLQLGHSQSDQVRLSLHWAWSLTKWDKASHHGKKR